MASNITPSQSKTTGFATTNMRPAADEEVAALWGQNISDALGYLLYVAPKHYASWTIVDKTTPVDAILGTQWFIKQPGHNTLIGTVSGYADGNTTDSFRVYVNSTKIVDEDWKTAGVNFATSISYDISGLTDYSWNRLEWEADPFGGGYDTRTADAVFYGTRL